MNSRVFSMVPVWVLVHPRLDHGPEIIHIQVHPCILTGGLLVAY